MSKKENITLRSAKIKICKLKKLLWECYIVLKNHCKPDENDFLIGSEETFGSLRKDEEEELKVRVRKVFEKK